MEGGSCNIFIEGWLGPTVDLATSEKKIPSKVMQGFSFVIRGGADKSLAGPTSQCCRMESIVLSGKGVCSCAELQDFSCY
jgi:hypothetical protein